MQQPLWGVYNVLRDNLLCTWVRKQVFLLKRGFSNSSPCFGVFLFIAGSDSCREFTEKDLLRMLYMILDGDRQIWNEDFRKDWSESSKELCDWHGVTCQDGEIIGLSFPNSGLQL
jgi:hypothetical protein